MITIPGTDILFSLDGNPIACASEFDINFEVDFLDHSDQTTTNGKNFLASVMGFNIEIGGVMTFLNREFLITFLEGFVKLDFQYYTSDAAEGRYIGQCWVSGYGESSPSNSYSRYNCSFLGEGKPQFIAETP